MINLIDTRSLAAVTVPIFAGTDFPHSFGEMDDHYRGLFIQSN